MAPLDIVKLGIRYFIRLVGWMKVAEIVRDEFTDEKQKQQPDEADC